MGEMRNRETFRALLTVICGIFAIWICDKMDVVSGQGIRGVIVNNQIVENGGKVNFIYPSGYTKMKNPSPTNINYGNPSNILTSTSFSSDSSPSPIVSSSQAVTHKPFTTKSPTPSQRPINKNSHTTKRPTKKPSPTSHGVLVTKNDFIYNPSPILVKDAIVQSTKSPQVNFAYEKLIKPRPHNVPIIQNPNSIINILKQNTTEDEKMNQIMQTLKVNGSSTPFAVGLKKNTQNSVNKRTPVVRNVISSGVKSATAGKIQQTKAHTNSSALSDDQNSKDSKELKVQFVLDCDLKDSLKKGHYHSNGVHVPQRPTVPYRKAVTRRKTVYSPYQVTKKPIRKYAYGGGYAGSVFFGNPVKPQKVQKQRKKKVQEVYEYIDPPVIATIKDTFASIYSFFEEALTTNYVSDEVESDEKPAKARKKKRKTVSRKGLKGKKRRPISKRSTVSKRPTSTPERRFTQPYEATQKQKLTTQIHVTSEYTEPELIKPAVHKPVRKESEEGDDIYYGDYYGDEDGDYYEDFSFGTGDDDEDEDDEDDDDDDEESEEEESSETIEEYDENVIDPLPDSHKEKTENIRKSEAGEKTKSTTAKKKKTKKTKKKRRRPASNDDDDIEYEEYDYAASMQNMGGIFNGAFSAMGKFIPSFPSFGSWGGFDTEDSNEEHQRTERSTTPRAELRKPKKPAVQFYEDDYVTNDLEESESEKLNRWYNPFVFGSTGEETTTPLVPSSTAASFFSWFSGADDEVKETVTEAVTEGSNWFMGLFGTPAPVTTTTTATTTTTPPPFLAISNPLHNPQNWLGILANHMATTTTPKPKTFRRPGVPQKVYYHNYQLWRLMPSSDSQIQFLRDYKMSSDGEKIQWWQGPAMRGPTDILVAPDVVAEVKENLEYESISYDVVLWDLEKAIKYENPTLSGRKKLELEAENGHPMTWHRYHEYDDITKFLDYLNRNYPEIVELIHIGRSFEGRPLTVVKISFDQYDTVPSKKGNSRVRKKKKTSKPGIFIEAGVHGREWISPAVATFLCRELVKHDKQNDTDAETVRSVDWYILPVLNPDGYEFSHSYDRMWRKTRSKYTDNGESILTMALTWLQTQTQIDPSGTAFCYGTDPNRNWGNSWNSKGSSSSPCSEFYAGPKAFSEPETKALSLFLQENQKYLSLFLSLHSYGQVLAYPTSANSSYNTHKSSDMMDMAEIAMDSLRNFASSARYSIDNTNEMLDQRSGTSDSYAMHDVGIKYSYTMQLRDTGTHGYLLPPTYIDATGKETFEMIKAMVDYL